MCLIFYWKSLNVHHYDQNILLFSKSIKLNVKQLELQVNVNNVHSTK
jgi:hypothetical protein